MKLVTVLMLCALAVGCGYGSSSMMPTTAGTVPTISALVPNNMSHGSQQFPLMVNGGSFNSGAFVTFNGIQMATTWTNSGLITATIPASAVATAGNVNVTVTNPAMGGRPGYGGGSAAATSTPAVFMIN